MALHEVGMHRAGLAFAYRIIPVLVATLLYGVYITLLSMATRGLWQRGLKVPSNMMVLVILYVVFCLTTALWILEVAQLFGLVDLLLSPDGLDTDALFNRFYDVIARETKVTGVLFELQMIVGDVLVIWRASAIWFNRRIVMLLPLFWWGLMIVNMLAHASRCQSGVATTDYTKLCKVTDVAAPVLSIVTNISVMILVLLKAWELRNTFRDVLRQKKSNKIFMLFVLMVESGMLYVIMLIADLLITSIVTGGNETVGRMVDCISGYAAVQFVGIYPTLLMVVLQESLWNSGVESSQGPALSTVRFAAQHAPPGSYSTNDLSRLEGGTTISPTHVLDIPTTSEREYRKAQFMNSLGEQNGWQDGDKVLGVAP